VTAINIPSASPPIADSVSSSTEDIAHLLSKSSIL